MFLLVFILVFWALNSYLLNLIPVSNWFLFLWIVVALLGTLLFVVLVYLALIFFSSKKNTTGSIRHFMLRNVTVLGTKMYHIHVDVEGLENVNKKDTYLIVANHKSQMDPLIIYNALHIKCSAVGKSTLFNNKMMVMIGKTFGAVSLDRDNDRSAVKSLNQTMDNIKNNLSMMIFPEGGIISRDYEEMRELRAGAYKIALKTKAPVLPISIIGSSKIASTKRRQRKNVKLVIHKPVTPEDYEGMSTTELGEKCMDIINSSILKS